MSKKKYRYVVFDEKMVMASFRVPKDIMGQINYLSTLSGVSRSDLLREAVDQFLSRAERKRSRT